MLILLIVGTFSPTIAYAEQSESEMALPTTSAFEATAQFAATRTTADFTTSLAAPPSPNADESEDDEVSKEEIQYMEYLIQYFDIVYGLKLDEGQLNEILDATEADQEEDGYHMAKNGENQYLVPTKQVVLARIRQLEDDPDGGLIDIANAHYSKQLGTYVCDKGYIGDSPVKERGCWLCNPACDSSHACKYPGLCVCSSDNCAPKAPTILGYQPIGNDKRIVAVSFASNTTADSNHVFCMFDDAVVKGELFGDHQIRCKLPNSTEPSTLSISLDGVKWSQLEMLTAYSTDSPSYIDSTNLVILTVSVSFLSVFFFALVYKLFFSSIYYCCSREASVPQAFVSPDSV